MRYILLLFTTASLLFSQINSFPPGGGGGVPVVTATPATCTPGGNPSMVFVSSNGTSGAPYFCSAVNTWSAIGSSSVSITTSCLVSGGPITGTGNVGGSVLLDPQNGSAPYAIPTGDCGKIVSRNQASAVSDTLAQAGSGGNFPNGWFAWYQCLGAGGCTVTPTTSTIDGASSLALVQNTGVLIESDGSNYYTTGSRGTVTSVGTNDTNVTLSLAGGIITPGWQNALSSARGGLGSNFSGCTGIPTFSSGSSTCTSSTGSLGNVVYSVSPTITGHMTVEGITPTGATGSGKFVFDTTPTISNLTVSGNLTTGITGTTQCVHANSSGILSGTGSDCGSGGGGSSVWSSLTNPTANLSLSTSGYTTTFIWGASTGASTNLFNLTDTTGNTGTGHLLSVNVASGSSALPVFFGVNGVGVQVGNTGVLSPSGGGHINTDEINNTLLSGLSSGPLFNTTSTGVPRIGVFGTDLPGLSSSNAWTGANDFSSASSLTLPSGSGLQPTTSGRPGYDLATNLYWAGYNGSSYPFAFRVGTWTDAHIAVYNAATGGLTDGGAALNGISGQTAGRYAVAGSSTTITTAGNLANDTNGQIRGVKAFSNASCTAVTYNNGSTTNLDISGSNSLCLTIPTSGTTTLAVINPPSTGSAIFTLYYTQDATTAGSVTFPANFLNACSPTKVLGKHTWQTFEYDTVLTDYVGKGCNSDDVPGVITGPETSSLTTDANCVAGAFCIGSNSSTHRLEAKTNGGATLQMMVDEGADVAANGQVTNGSHITNGSIPVSGLANAATTVDGSTCTLGSTCTTSFAAQSDAVASAHVLGTTAGKAPFASTASDLGAIVSVSGGGTAQAQTVTLAPAVTSLTYGLHVWWTPAAANTGAGPTLAVNGLAATAITKCGTTALVANDLTTTAVAHAVYDGTRFQLLNPMSSGCGTASAGVSSFTGDTALINNSASTGAVTVTLTNAAGHSYWGNATGSSGPPSYILFGTGVDTFLGTPSGANFAAALTSGLPNSALANSSMTIAGHSVSLGGTQAISASDVGLGSVTNDAQTKAAVVPNTTPGAGQIMVGNAGGTAYAPVTASGCTITSAGAFTCTPTAVGLSNVTNNTQTQAAIVPNTVPSAGQILAGNAGGTAYAPVSMSQDCTMSSAGVITCTKTNNTAFSALATTAPGTGVTTALGSAVSGSGSLCLTTSCAMTTPALGTPTALVLTNATGLPTAGLVNNAVTSAKLAVVNTRRVCDIGVGDTSASAALTNAQLGPQKRICYIPAAATVVEMDVAADGGTPNVIVAVDHAGTNSNIVSAALATAASGGIACSNTGGTTGIDGATTCSATLQNTSMAAGDYLELVSGTAGGTAKWMTVHVIYTVN